MNAKKANNRRFYAKLMLFGEYSAIHRSKALTIPFKNYGGELSYLPDKKNPSFNLARESNRQMLEYAKFLKYKIDSEGIAFDFNIDQLLQDLNKDLDKGLYFKSSIPQGYGTGSSGALIAAIFDRYGPVFTPEPQKLREYFSFMENFFHGQSSGIDPLVSYYYEPLLVHGDDFKIVEKPNLSPTNNEGILLADTGQTSKTGPLVELFLTHSKNKKIDAPYLSKLNNNLIENLINEQFETFYNQLNILSEWQLKNMQAMIPAKMLDFWQDGLTQNLWTTKLCGSGGGGFLLIFTKNYASAFPVLQNYNMRFIPVQVPV